MGGCDIVLEMHHPSRGGSITTDRTATGWAQARALYEAIFGGRRSSDPVRSCAVGASDPAPSKRSTQMTIFTPTLMQTLRMARLLTILFVPALAACGQSQSQPQASSPPPQVTIAKPVSKMVADQDEYVGRFVAVESVEVRARVPGYLQAIHFQDGQMVKEGDLLFTIDRRPFQIALAQTQASLAQARATLAFAESDLARAQGLTLGTVITQQTFDQRTQAKRIAEASVAAQQGCRAAGDARPAIHRATRAGGGAHRGPARVHRQSRHRRNLGKHQPAGHHRIS